MQVCKYADMQVYKVQVDQSTGRPSISSRQGACDIVTQGALVPVRGNQNERYVHGESAGRKEVLPGRVHIPLQSAAIKSRGKLFFRLAQQAVAIGPVPYDRIVHSTKAKAKVEPQSVGAT